MKSFCRFEVKVLRAEKFINEISSSFLICDIEKKEGNIISFKANPRQSKNIKKYLAKKEIQVLGIYKKGAYYSFLKTLTSWGIITGVVLGSIFFFVQTHFIKQVEIWGDGIINEQEIVDFIAPKVINIAKQKIDTKELEVEIYDTFDNLSFVSVAIVGQTVIVNIKKEINPVEMEGEFISIKAKEDGKITDIDLIQGTLCVQVGDIVKKGDDLVLPYIMNSQGEKQNIIPKAKILADVWIISEVQHNSYYKENYRTGEKIIKNEVMLYGLEIYDNKKENTFENFDTVIKDKKISQNNILPLILRETTYYELAERVVEKKFEDVKEEILEECKRNNLQKISDCEIIKNENTIIKEAGNITTVVYTIVVNRNIGG